jgi:acetyltransferase-like isoleucine patch superfamily enzyme
MIRYGTDVRIDPTAVFTNPYLVDLGSHIAIDYGFYGTTAMKVGDWVHISSHVSLIGGAASKLTIDHFGFISTGSRIICGSDKMLGEGLVGPFIPRQYQDEHDCTPVIIGRYAGTGCNAMMLPGSELGEGAILGAGALLKGYAEPWTIYAGNPAKPIKSRPSEKIKEYAKEMSY